MAEATLSSLQMPWVAAQRAERSAGVRAVMRKSASRCDALGMVRWQIIIASRIWVIVQRADYSWWINGILFTRVLRDVDPQSWGKQ